MTPNLLLVPSARKSGKLYSVLPIDGSGDLTFTRASTATELNGSGLLSSVATGVPRLDYTNSTCPRFLLEPARTNLITYSQEFDNASWVKTSTGTGSIPVVTPNAGLAPDGTMTADRVVFNASAASGDRSILRKTVAATATTGVHSYWIKSNTGTTQYVSGYYGTTTASLTITTEWQRFTFGGAVLQVYSGLEVRNGVTIATTADILVWGGQLEDVSSYASSYIPTTSAAVTRAADSSSLTGLKSKGLIGVTEGSIGGEFVASSLVRESGVLSLYFGNLSSDYFYFDRANTNPLRFRIGFGISGFASSYQTLQDQNKWLFAWDASGWYLSVNGTIVASGAQVFNFPIDNLSLNGAGGKWELSKLYSYTTKLTEIEANNLTK